MDYSFYLEYEIYVHNDIELVINIFKLQNYEGVVNKKRVIYGTINKTSLSVK